jgi:hypothetical protein
MVRLLRALAAALPLLSGGVHGKQVVLSNLALPVDTAGNALLTGEATLVQSSGVWYLYTNNWGGCPGVDCCTMGKCAACCFSPPSPAYPDACVYTANHSVVVYATTDFETWSFGGVALPVSTRRAGTEFRPQVIPPSPTRSTWLMWYEDRWTEGKTNPGYALATSATPFGPFVTADDTVVIPGQGRVGDYDLFVDEDGTCYHVRTGITVVQLNSSCTGPSEVAPYELPNGGVEGPSMFKRGGLYYLLVGLGCCACKGGSNVVVYTASAPLGPFTLAGDVGSNTTAGHTFEASSPYNFVTRAQGSKVAVVPAADGTLQYLWLGNTWVSSRSGARNADLLYWTVLNFDDAGNITQIVRADSAVLSLPG